MPPPALPVPEPGSDWRDWPLTPGSWSYSSNDSGTVAMFVNRQGRALLITCFKERLGVAITGAFGSGALTIRTTSVARAVPTAPVEDGTGYRRVTLAPTDPLLDALAFSRGRFVIEQAGRPPLVVPAHAEVGRVTEDCRG